MTVNPLCRTFKAGDLLTCTSDGYPEPSYKWTDSNGVIVSTIRRTTLPEGWFNLTCTATGNFSSQCSASSTIIGNADTITYTTATTIARSIKYGMNTLQ